MKVKLRLLLPSFFFLEYWFDFIDNYTKLYVHMGTQVYLMYKQATVSVLLLESRELNLLVEAV